MAARESLEQVRTVCLLILTIIAVGVALYWLKPVMVPFVLALFATYALAPLIDLQIVKLRFPRPVAIASTLLLGVVLFLILWWLVASSVAELQSNIDIYRQNLDQLLTRISDKFEVDRDRLLAPLTKFRDEDLSSLVVTTMSETMGILSQGFLVLIFAVFMLLGRDVQESPTDDFQGEVESKVQRYLIVKIVVSAMTGMIVWLILHLLGIPLAMVFGLLSFILNFIPNIGSAIACLLPLPIVLVSPGISTTSAILAIALPSAVQFTVGNVVEPKLMGKSLDLHPVAVLVALIFWGMLWGIPGMLLAAPMTSVAKILFEQWDITRPLAKLLTGDLGVSQASAQRMKSV
ncbi:MAG: AI-2E family transporter [Pirellulales bacterium]|nr:AI-2E family transporter [Pirellulales bacterium]